MEIQPQETPQNKSDTQDDMAGLRAALTSNTSSAVAPKGEQTPAAAKMIAMAEGSAAFNPKADFNGDGKLSDQEKSIAREADDEGNNTGFIDTPEEELAVYSKNTAADIIAEGG